MKRYEVIRNYRGNNELRSSFNRLAGKTFGLDFEDWYQNGYWKDAYNPYSIIIDGQVAANVSVNRTDFVRNGVRKRFIQLGTVMTEEKYRNQGLIRQIMEEIDREYEKSADGVYLFANDSVLDFYPKFGFRREEEVLHTKQAVFHKECTMELLPMRDHSAWDRLERVIRSSHGVSALRMIDNSSLIMFYITKFMQENVYYEKDLDAYAVAEIKDGHLLLCDVFSEKAVDLHMVLEAFGRKIRQISLGFTPEDPSGFDAQKLHEEDTTLFVRGKGFEGFSSWDVRFPLLAHA